MDKKKLNAKDFINIGIFTVIYFVMFFITGMLGYIPIFAVIIPLVLGILGGIPFMLFLTKTGKFGAATIMGTLVSVLCFLMGQSWISIPFGIVFGFLADLIFKSLQQSQHLLQNPLNFLFRRNQSLQCFHTPLKAVQNMLT